MAKAAKKQNGGPPRASKQSAQAGGAPARDPSKDKQAGARHPPRPAEEQTVVRTPMGPPAPREKGAAVRTEGQAPTRVPATTTTLLFAARTWPTPAEAIQSKPTMRTRGGDEREKKVEQSGAPGPPAQQQPAAGEDRNTGEEAEEGPPPEQDPPNGGEAPGQDPPPPGERPILQELQQRLEHAISMVMDLLPQWQAGTVDQVTAEREDTLLQ